MVTRNSFRGTQRVTVAGLSARADKRLQDIAGRYQTKFETALAVDGVVGYIWNKVRGTMPCTCRGFTLRRSYDTSRINQGQVVKGDQLPISDNMPDTVNTEGAFSYVGEHVTRQKKSAEFTTPRTVKQSEQQRIQQPSSKTLELHEETGDYPDNVDILDALGNSADGSDGPSPFIAKPLSTPSQSVMCPICLGQGLTDTWQLYGGHRIVLDYSNMHVVDLDNADITNTQPATFTLFRESQLKWLNVYLPMMWSRLLRVAVYNRGELLNPNDYTLYYIHPSAPNTLNPMTFNTLNSINGGALLQSGNKVQVGIGTAKDSLKFTHIELLFQMSDLVKMQIPELEMADDTEWADWNMNATFEVSANVEIRESSYVVEGKYKRVWKVTSINRKLTATGKPFGSSINVRALHPQEKAYVLLNILGKPLDPFSSIVDDMIDEFDF